MVRRAGAAVVLIGCITLSACTPTDAEPTVPSAPTSVSTTPAPSTTAPPTTATPTGAPLLPDAARQQTPEGAEAFVRYWFDLLNFAYAAMDVGPYLAASSPECRTCEALAGTVSDVLATGNRIDGGQITIKQAEGSSAGGGESATVTVLFGAAELREVNADGALVRVIEADGGDVQYLVDVTWSQSAWSVSAARLFA